MPNLIQHRSERKDHLLIVPGDHTGRKLTFVVKESRSSSVRKIEKKNIAAGGSDDEITASFINGSTRIIVKMYPLDTLLLNPVPHFADLVSVDPRDDTDRKYIWDGDFTIVQNVQRDTDTLGVTPPDVYTPLYYKKYLRFVKASAEDAVQKAKIGYGNITISEENSVISIKSDGDFSDETCIYCNNSEVNFSYISDSLIEFYMPQQFGKVVIEVWEK